MNRYNEEQRKKQAWARRDLSPAEIVELNKQEALDASHAKLARYYHTRLFPEEYDYQFTSYLDSVSIAKNGHPYTQEHAEFIENKRLELGVDSFLNANGERLLSVTYVRNLVHESNLEVLDHALEKFGR